MADHDQTSSPGPDGSRLELASRIPPPHWIFRQSIDPGIERAESPNSSDSGRSRVVDVVCCGMYRACSTWQYEVAAHLVEHKTAGERVGYQSGADYQTLTDGRQGRPMRSRVLKSHDAAPSLGRALTHGHAVGLYSYRDLRDVVFSLMHKRGLSFRGLVRQGMIPRILANDRFWTRRPGVLVQRYEDLLAEPGAGVAAIAAHLGIELDPGEADRIAAEYSREANRSRARALAHRLHEAGVDLRNAASIQICDPGTLLHWNHLRESGDGSWRALATPRQLAILDRLCGRWLETHGYARVHAPADATISLRERIEDAVDLALGQARFLMGDLSARLPRLASVIKRLVRVKDAAGATAWSESPAGSGQRTRNSSAVEHD